MLEEIKVLGKLVGFKFVGGVCMVVDVVIYFGMVDEIMGVGWVGL